MTLNVVEYKHHTESEKTLLFNEKFNLNTEISVLREDSYPKQNNHSFNNIRHTEVRHV